MASFRLPLVLFLSSIFIYAAQGDVICENLPKEHCAFAISITGKRCLLETSANKEYQCKTSEIVVRKQANYIETDACINACGLDRNTVGISSDALLDPKFTAKLCSVACYHRCPNIVDLFFNLASGEGTSLPNLCNEARKNTHRMAMQVMSSGAVDVEAEGPSAARRRSVMEEAEGPSGARRSVLEEAYGPSSAEGPTAF